MRACQYLGNILVNRENRSQQDLSTAFTYYERACKGGLPEACANLGAMYEEGWSVPVDLAKAREYYQRTCSERTAVGCTDLGYLYEYGRGVAKDYNVARRAYERACEASDKGCNELGCLYSAGHGVVRDVKRAAALYSRACDARLGQGCLNLAQLQVASSHPNAVNGERSSRRGCELGYPPACHYNGLLQSFMNLTERPESRARAQTDCERGDSKRCFELGLRLAIGFGVNPDVAKANRLFERACEQQVEAACRFVRAPKR